MKNHPECLSGEMHLTNCNSEENFKTIGWKSKRKGEHAYDTGEKMIGEGYFPVFIKISELLDEFQKTPANSNRRATYERMLLKVGVGL